MFVENLRVKFENYHLQLWFPQLTIHWKIQHSFSGTFYNHDFNEYTCYETFYSTGEDCKCAGCDSSIKNLKNYIILCPYFVKEIWKKKPVICVATCSFFNPVALPYLPSTINTHDQVTTWMTMDSGFNFQQGHDTFLSSQVFRLALEPRQTPLQCV